MAQGARVYSCYSSKSRLNPTDLTGYLRNIEFALMEHGHPEALTGLAIIHPELQRPERVGARNAHWPDSAN